MDEIVIIAEELIREILASNDEESDNSWEKNNLIQK